MGGGWGNVLGVVESNLLIWAKQEALDLFEARPEGLRKTFFGSEKLLAAGVEPLEQLEQPIPIRTHVH